MTVKADGSYRYRSALKGYTFQGYAILDCGHSSSVTGNNLPDTYHGRGHAEKAALGLSLLVSQDCFMIRRRNGMPI
jgi:hypothetical protein